MRTFLSILTILALTACTGAQKTSETGGTGDEAYPGEGVPWKDKNHDQEKAYMKHVVMPEMKALFQSHDATKYAEMNCTTCHGAGVEKGEFHMPSPDLPPMEFDKWKAEHPEMMTFMGEQVKPKMAELLGTTPFDPETGTGLGCGACHPKAAD